MKARWPLFVFGIAALALLAGVAPLLGVHNIGGGRTLTWLGWHAFTPDSEAAQLFALRLPRVLASLLVGASLGLAGGALQALLRNPLAEPYTLGISSGAALFGTLGIRLGLEAALGGYALGLLALLGAGLTMWLVWRLANARHVLNAESLILAGVGVSMFCAATSVLLMYTADFVEMSRIFRWTMGDLETTPLASLLWAALAAGLAATVLLRQGPALNALALGEEVAASVGVATHRTHGLVFGAASLLVAISIAVAGPIGFVGLIVPHVVRRRLGPDARLLLPLSALGGAALLLVCDTVARTVVAPQQLPPGAITAALGGPFFLAALLRRQLQ